MDKALEEWRSQGNKDEDFFNEDYLEKHPRGRAYVEKATARAKAAHAESKRHEAHQGEKTGPLEKLDLQGARVGGLDFDGRPSRAQTDTVR